MKKGVVCCFLAVFVLLMPRLAHSADWKLKTVSYQGMKFTLDYIDHTPGKWQNSTITILKVKISAPGLSNIDVGQEDGVAFPSIAAQSDTAYAVNLSCLWPAYADGNGIYVKAEINGQKYTWYPFKKGVEGEINGVKPKLESAKTYSTGTKTCAGK